MSLKWKKWFFVLQYREFITQTNRLLDVLNSIQKTLKTKQFSKETVIACLEKFDTLNDDNAKKIGEMIKIYFADTFQKMPETPMILCSSDIIESCFGKYKEVVKSNKSVGITDLCLSISCLTSLGDFKQTKNALECVKIKQIKQWKDENVGESLFAKKNILFRKAG